MAPATRRARIIRAVSARLFDGLQRIGFTLSCYHRSRMLVAVLRLCGVPARIRYAVRSTDPREGHCWVDALEDAAPQGWDVIATGR